MTQEVNFVNSTLPDIVELKNIRQTYDGTKYIIDGLNLLIEDAPNRGQFVVILGESGCGKSTLLRYVAGLQKPTEGEVLIKSVKQEGQIHIGMVFQQYSSFPWLTAEENIEYPLKLRGIVKAERKKTVDELLVLMNLWEQRKNYAKYGAMSGGQLQRVAIARSLAHNPEILLMDEPFGALDARTRLAMQETILKTWAKYQSTIIFVTHDITEAVYLADEIWIMKARPGRISEKIDINAALGPERYPLIKKSPDFARIAAYLEERIMKE